jgi:hypothetical protein
LRINNGRMYFFVSSRFLSFPLDDPENLQVSIPSISIWNFHYKFDVYQENIVIVHTSISGLYTLRNATTVLYNSTFFIQILGPTTNIRPIALRHIGNYIYLVVTSGHFLKLKKDGSTSANSATMFNLGYQVDCVDFDEVN